MYDVRKTYVRGEGGMYPVVYAVFEHSSPLGRERKLSAVQLTLKKPVELMTKNWPSANPDPLITSHWYSAVGYASLPHDNLLLTVKFFCIQVTHAFFGQSVNKRCKCTSVAL